MKIENSVFIFNIQSKFPLYFVKKEAKFVSRYLNEMHMNEIFETLILHSFSKLAKVGIKISRKDPSTLLSKLERIFSFNRIRFEENFKT